MLALVYFVPAILASPFKSKSRLEAENAALRHQVMVLRRQVRGRVCLTNLDRLFLVQLYHWFTSILRVLAIVQPATVVRWHRAGFHCYWRWKSRARGGVCTENYIQKRIQYWRSKFPVRASKFPVPPKYFPVLLRRDFRCKPLNLLACQPSKSQRASGFDDIPCSFPC